MATGLVKVRKILVHNMGKTEAKVHPDTFETCQD